MSIYFCSSGLNDSPASRLLRMLRLTTVGARLRANLFHLFHQIRDFHIAVLV